ncbi:MAG: filamentous hemagglutinin N-terminal domain-containing protein, partial [Planctomycetota bacterium]
MTAAQTIRNPARSSPRLPLGILIGAAWAFCLIAPARAQVEGEQVINGQVTFERHDDQTLIHAGDQSIIEYSRFNIAPEEIVQFIQPDAASRVLNRVLDANPSLIQGTLLANGIVYIVNPAGVYFSQGSLVDAGGIYAAAGSISNADFLAGIDRFTALQGSVIQRGTMQADQVFLAGSHVSNEGVINAPSGLVVLSAGDEILLGERDGHVMVKIYRANADTGLSDAAGVANSGDINAKNGTILLSAGDLYALAIRQSGRLQAGRVEITGQGNGIVEAGGELWAQNHSLGGRVEITGEKVAVTGRINASGEHGGGTILIGGDYQGKGMLSNAAHTLVMPEALLTADAVQTGDGGTIIVWSDLSTQFYGRASATGGALSGNGGFAEVSGKQSLRFRGGVDLSAAYGESGRLLLDPLNISISTAADTNTAGFTPPGDLTEAFADDAGLDSVFDVTAGTGSFAGVASGTTIELQATNDISVDADFNIATSTGSSDVNLVLRSGNDINVNSVITASGTGTLTLSADDNTPDGAGDITLSSSGGLVTANQDITLTSNDISIDSSATFNAGSGTVTLLASDGAAMGLGDTAGGYTVSGSELQRITAANLVMGNASNDTITVDNITAANSNNISGTVTLNATKTGQSVAFSNN